MTMHLKSKIIWILTPIYLLALWDELLYTEAYMKSVRVEEIPFAQAMTRTHNHTSRVSALKRPQEEQSRSIYALKRLDQHKGFLKIFNVPCKNWNENYVKYYGDSEFDVGVCVCVCVRCVCVCVSICVADIICFFAAKGKWPFIPPFMQNRVDAAARTLFTQNDTFIKQFCQKWIQIKECFRPIFCK